jgi:hypothetical protein
LLREKNAIDAISIISAKHFERNSSAEVRRSSKGAAIAFEPQRLHYTKIICSFDENRQWLQRAEDSENRSQSAGNSASKL